MQNSIKNKGTEKNRCFDCALKLLSVRDYGEKELFSKLKSKGFDKKSCDYSITKCIEYKYIDDKAYAVKLFKNEKSKLNGPFKIKFSMLAKKLDELLISEIISGYEGSDEEYETAKRYLNKIKYKLEKKNSKQKKYAYFIQTMNSKGFSKDTIMGLYEEFSHIFHD